MKKYKEWLVNEINVMESETSEYYPHEQMVEREVVLNLINQQDEPEVLSQGENINIVLNDLKEYIKEQQSLSQNVGLAHTSTGNDTHYRQYDYVLECINEYEPSDYLQNLLVPKQEELESAIKVLIEAYKQEEDAHGELENGWIRGFIKDLKNLVEEEQKYYVMNNHNRVMLGRMMDGKTITEADPFKLEDMYEGEKKSHRLTEQEIKDYDSRYWAFAVKVEELED